MEKICLVTGGTGGHIYPALALAQVWKEQRPDLDLFFIGNEDRMESDLIPSYGYTFYGMKTSGLEGSMAHKLKAVCQYPAAMLSARKLLKKEKPDLVMGFGGYVSAPVLWAASSLGIPVLMHEQNSVVGKANKLVMNKASGIVTCYEKCSEVFDAGKTRLLGNPRATLAARAKADPDYFKSLGLDPALRTILIVMGSLGSSSINELMKSALKDLDPSLQVLYVCGKDNDQDLNLFGNAQNIHVVPYVDTMKLYGLLDGMICRAGATTLAELTALGIPAVIIPSPYVANNHQYYNAKMLTDKGAAYLIEEKDLNADTLSAAIKEVFLDEEHRKAYASRAKEMGKPNAAYDIIDFAESFIQSK